MSNDDSRDISRWESFDRFIAKTDDMFVIESELSNKSYYKSAFTEKNCIGTGRFGQVYRVQNIYDGKDYAVKKLLITGI